LWPGSNVKAPCWAIARAKLAINGIACTCKYRNISSDRHLPMRRMTSVSTWAHRRAIAPPGRRLHAEMSLGWIPKLGRSCTATPRSCAVILAAVISFHHSVDFSIYSGVVCVACSARSARTRRPTARTGQPYSGLAGLAPCPIFSPHTPFF
jgi:hypothetical protein